MDDAQAQQTNPLFGIIPKEFFTPLASPNRLVYWDCLCRLFQAMSAQLSFGIEREILVDELQFYFEQNQAAEFEEDDINGMDSRKKANEMLRLLEKYGWLEVETDKSYVQRVNFYDYAVKVMKTLLEISDGRKVEYQGYIYTIYSLVRTNTDHPAVVLQQIREIPVGQAEELVYQTLHEIVEAFRNMDDILAEINRKNTQYQRAAVNRAKFLLAGTEDVRGQMKEILLYIGEQMEQSQLDLNGIYEIEYLENLVRLFGSSFIDEKSFYSPIEGKKEFHPQELIETMPDVEFRQEKLRKMTEKMQRILSPERIERFVEEQLGDRAKIYASELPMETMDDFIRLIYVRLYGSRKKMRYRIEKAEGANKISGEFDFPDFAIIKR